jgi:hypothetical protein
MPSQAFATKQLWALSQSIWPEKITGLPCSVLSCLSRLLQTHKLLSPLQAAPFHQADPTTSLFLLLQGAPKLLWPVFIFMTEAWCLRGVSSIISQSLSFSKLNVYHTVLNTSWRLMIMLQAQHGASPYHLGGEEVVGRNTYWMVW